MVKVSKVSSSTRKIGKVSKTIGALGTVISKIPDLTEVAGRTIDATAPIIEKISTATTTTKIASSNWIMSSIYL